MSLLDAPDITVGPPLNNHLNAHNSTIQSRTRLIDICTNSGYMTNSFRLHKYDIPSRAPRTFMSMLLLLLAGDIARNPGPPVAPMYPCGVCQLAVNWSHKAIACDACDVWVHKSCASLDSAAYESVENVSDAPWKCYCCNSINVLLFTYHAFNLDVSNNYSILAGIPGNDSVYMSSIASPTEQFTPKTHSSPTVLLTDAELSEPSQSDILTPDALLPSSIRHSRGSRLSSSMPNQVPGNLRIGVVDINGMRGKRAELAELVNSTRADIFVITETKIDNTMNPSEFLPRHFNGSIHRNRNAHGGGVMLAMKKGIIAEEVELKASKSGEITCAKIHLAKANPLYVCAYYRPPSDATESLDNLESALEELHTITARNPKSGIIMAGDFNTRDID